MPVIGLTELIHQIPSGLIFILTTSNPINVIDPIDLSWEDRARRTEILTSAWRAGTARLSQRLPGSLRSHSQASGVRMGRGPLAAPAEPCVSATPALCGQSSAIGQRLWLEASPPLWDTKPSCPWPAPFWSLPWGLGAPWAVYRACLAIGSSPGEFSNARLACLRGQVFSIVISTLLKNELKDDLQ